MDTQLNKLRTKFTEKVKQLVQETKKAWLKNISMSILKKFLKSYFEKENHQRKNNKKIYRCMAHVLIIKEKLKK